jgi:hypothetical protein
VLYLRNSFLFYMPPGLEKKIKIIFLFSIAICPKWCYTILLQRGAIMSKAKQRYTHNYLSLYTANAHGDADSCDYYIALFEQQASAHLEGLRAEDVGGVVIYLDAEGLEAAYFDYENLVGSIYSVTGLRSDELA